MKRQSNTEKNTYIKHTKYQNIKILVNNSLNLNISLVDGYIIINCTNPKNIEGYDELYESINKYKFLYSINNDLLQSYSDSEKINVIKKNIELCKDNISIVCYYLIEQPEQAL
jgi:hypothetical protein